MGGRRQNKIELRGNTYIVGEGITEQYYFAHLKQLRKYNCVIKPRFFGKTSISEIEKSVHKLLLGGVQVICVFDADVSVRDEAENKKLEQFRKRYGRNKNVILCESFPSIEFWFLLHYLKTTRNFQNAAEALKELKKYLPEFSKETSFLEKQKWVEELCANGKLTTAMTHASEILTEKATGINGKYFPYTKVVKGIEWFEGKSTDT
jgi:hypothetical protein